MLIGAFQAVASLNRVSDLMKENVVDRRSRASSTMVEEFARCRTQQVCEAYYTYARNGQYAGQKSLEHKVNYETLLARKGLFPVDFLRHFSFPDLKAV